MLIDINYRVNWRALISDINLPDQLPIYFYLPGLQINFSAILDGMSGSKSNKSGHMHFLPDKSLPNLQIQNQSPC